MTPEKEKQVPAEAIRFTAWLMKNTDLPKNVITKGLIELHGLKVGAARELYQKVKKLKKESEADNGQE